VDVRIRVALESKSEHGSTWRFYAESTDDTDLSPVIGTGTKMDPVSASPRQFSPALAQFPGRVVSVRQLEVASFVHFHTQQVVAIVDIVLS